MQNMTKTKYYRLSPQAEDDLEAIWFYTFENWSLEQADVYLQYFVAAFEELAIGKRQGQRSVFPHFQKYLCGAHVIYYIEHADCLDIIRVLHQRQDAPQHLSDL